jgi:hypothetical protein
MVMTTTTTTMSRGDAGKKEEGSYVDQGQRRTM